MSSTPNLLSLSKDELHEFMGAMLPEGFAEKKAEPQVQQQPPPGYRKVCLGLLSYDGRIHCRTMMCLLQAVMDCAKRGWGFTYILREADSMVARGRSFLASQFLENDEAKSCTDLVMIDTDLAWHGDEFMKLMDAPVDVIGGAYPFKDDSGDFPLRWPPDGLFEENGLWIVHAVTPGFFRVSRRALEKMAREMPWLEFKDRGLKEGQRCWMFFDNLHRPSGIYDEGYVFCERWRGLGGKVYLDPTFNIGHIGLKEYKHGNLRQWLDRKSETFAKLESDFPEIPPLTLMQKTMTSKDTEAAIEKLKQEKLIETDHKHRDAGKSATTEANPGTDTAKPKRQKHNGNGVSRRGRPRNNRDVQQDPVHAGIVGFGQEA